MAVSWKMDVGINHAPAYQVSGRPFASGGVDATTATKVSFPYVTRWVYIVNRTGEDVKVGFSELGVEGTNYFIVSRKNSDTRHSSARLEVKVADLWLSGSALVDVCAGLTSIPRDRTSMGDGLPSWSGSVGVG
jgi:hypothetical protein